MTTTPGLWDLKVDHADYEAVQAERMTWWHKICPNKTRGAHWKDRIVAVIDKADFENCNQAAIWFAGSPLEEGGPERADGKIEVYGDGYFERIGC